jgi:hypothetical protein
MKWNYKINLGIAIFLAILIISALVKLVINPISNFTPRVILIAINVILCTANFWVYIDNKRK